MQEVFQMLQTPIFLECAQCGYRWISKPRNGRVGHPLYCANPECRSARWSGRPDARFNPFRELAAVGNGAQ
jgi:hypothetical protein